MRSDTSETALQSPEWGSLSPVRVSLDVLKVVRESPAIAFDIETTHLYADFGHVLAAVFKPLGKKPIVLRLDEYHERPTNDDSPLILDTLVILAHSSLIYGWNTDRYDIPFVRTRKVIAQYEGRLPAYLPLAHFKSFDMLRLKRNFRLHNNRLGTWMTNFSETRKTDVKPREWRDAQFFDKPSMDYVVDHCVKDTEGTERVFKLVWNTMHRIQVREVVV